MPHFLGPFTAAHFVFPRDWDFKTTQGIITLEIDDTRHVEITMPSLYHFFVVHIVAECQKHKARNKDYVDPREVFSYLQQLHTKWSDLSGYKKIESIETLQANWRRTISTSVEYMLPIFETRKDKIYRAKTKLRVKAADVFQRVYKTVVEEAKSPRKKVFCRINVFNPSQIFYQESLLEGLAKWSGPGVKAHGASGTVKKLSTSIWPLRFADQVLDTSNTEARYFRRSGPVAVDIRSGMVCKPAEYDRLTAAFNRHNVVLLAGPKASGKTVLARMLAYEWMNSLQVALLELHQTIADPSRVIDECHSFARKYPSGLLIVDDGHLQPLLVAELLAESQHINCRILLTIRSPIHILQGQPISSFPWVSQIDMDSRSVQADIITSFCERHNRILNSKLRRGLLTVSEGNLWILSYALEGLATAEGTRIDRTLIYKNVKEDLTALANINTLYPRILIALSVLYRFELPTDLRFLYRRFSDYTSAAIEQAIRELCHRGEVNMCQHHDSYLYGLPHSALADMYFSFVTGSEWEEYAVYGDEIDFICSYIEFVDMGTATELFRNSDVNDLRRNGNRLERIVQKLNKQVFARRLQMHDELSDITFCILFFLEEDADAGAELWGYIDKELLAKRFFNSQQTAIVLTFLEGLLKEHHDLAMELWPHIDKEKLSSAILMERSARVLEDWIELVFRIVPGTGKELWKHIDRRECAKVLVHDEHIMWFGTCIQILYRADPDAGRELWGYIDKEAAARNILAADDLVSAGICIGAIFESNDDIGREFWKHLNTKELANKISYTSKTLDAADCLDHIYQKNVEAGVELWGHIDKEEFARNISSTNFLNAVDAAVCIEHLFKTDVDIGTELWRNVDKEKFASVVSDCDHGTALELIERMYKANKAAGEEFWGHIDKKKFVSFVTQYGIWNALECIDRIYKANKEAGEEFWGHIDKKKLATRLSNRHFVSDAGCFIEHIFKSNHEIGEELWGLIAKKKFANRISGIGDIEDAADCLYFVFDAKYELGEELWRLIDKEKFAKIVSDTPSIRDIGYCINRIYTANSDAGKELWEHINIEQIANKIEEIYRDDIVANCIKALFEANNEGCEELLGHMDKEKLFDRISESPDIPRPDKERLLGIISDTET